VVVLDRRAELVAQEVDVAVRGPHTDLELAGDIGGLQRPAVTKLTERPEEAPERRPS
jgi:hypothetical protein